MCILKEVGRFIKNGASTFRDASQGRYRQNSDAVSEIRKEIMEKDRYDQESIRELLSWAQDTLKNKTYPEGGMVLDKCIKVIDCKSHIEAMIQMISKNWENPTFYPTIDLFRRFRDKLKENI